MNNSEIFRDLVIGYFLMSLIIQAYEAGRGDHESKSTRTGSLIAMIIHGSIIAAILVLVP